MMLALAMVTGLSTVMGAQFGTTGSQAGARYVGTRPVLNRQNCRNFTERVDVLYNLIVSTQTTTTTGVVQQPYGVIYFQDSTIPAEVQTTTTTTTTTNGQTTTNPQQNNLYISPVVCNEPVADNILKDGIFLNPGTVSFSATNQGINQTVSDFMLDLCNSDGGVRKRRSLCLGIRAGQGQATTVRAGDGPDIDTEAPGEAQRIDTRPGDAEVQLTVTPPQGGDSVERTQMRYRVHYRKCSADQVGDAGVQQAADAGADGGVVDAAPEDLGSCGAYSVFEGAHQSPVTVNGLENDVGYEFRVIAVDEASNEGPLSAVRAFATPRKEYGFLDLYGDPEYQSTCQDSGGAVWMGAGVCAVLALGRRRRSGKRSHG